AGRARRRGGGRGRVGLGRGTARGWRGRLREGDDGRDERGREAGETDGLEEAAPVGGGRLRAGHADLQGRNGNTSQRPRSLAPGRPAGQCRRRAFRGGSGANQLESAFTGGGPRMAIPKRAGLTPTLPERRPKPDVQ